MVLAEPTKTNLRLYTVEEFWNFIERPENANGKYELINGVIVKHMPPSFEHGETALYIGSPMMIFTKQHDLGKVAVEVDHYLLPDRFNTRRPDVEFISKARLNEFDPTQYVPLMPDLAGTRRVGPQRQCPCSIRGGIRPDVTVSLLAHGEIQTVVLAGVEDGGSPSR